MKQALIVVDVQNDYFPEGSMELVGMDAAAANCAQLLSFFRAGEAPIFHIQHLSTRPGASFFVPATPGCEIHQSVTPQQGETLVVKHFPSAFRETRLDELLRAAGIGELMICGAMTHMCIDTTVRAAFDLGYQCEVAADACATRDLQFGGREIRAADVQTAFMAALGMPFAQISTTAEHLENA